MFQSSCCMMKELPIRLVAFFFKLEDKMFLWPSKFLLLLPSCPRRNHAGPSRFHKWGYRTWADPCSSSSSVPECIRLVKFQPGPPILLGFTSSGVASILVIMMSSESRRWWFRHPCPLEDDADFRNCCFRGFLHSSQLFPWSTHSICY